MATGKVAIFVLAEDPTIGYNPPEMPSDTSLSPRGPEEPAQTRVAYRLPITVVGDDSENEPFAERTFAENVTRGGAFVLTTRPLRVGSLLALHDADDYERRLCLVQIVWVRPDGEQPSGVGLKIVTDNATWIDYLVERSAKTLDEEPAEG